MKLINRILGRLDNYFSREEVEEIKRLESQIRVQKEVIEDYQAKQSLLSGRISEVQAALTVAQRKLASERQEMALEAYWNNTRPKTSLVYKARPIFGSTKLKEVDPRTFINPNDCSLPVHGAESNDELAEYIRGWVERNIKYQDDHTQFKEPECWLYAWETMYLKQGDCEDGAILMHNMMLKSGIPYWRVRLNAGTVGSGLGHAWVTYLRESDNKWVVLDWCYYKEESKDLGLLWSKAERYFNIWFSFNEKYIFQGATLDRTKQNN